MLTLHAVHGTVHVACLVLLRLHEVLMLILLDSLSPCVPLFACHHSFSCVGVLVTLSTGCDQWQSLPSAAAQDTLQR